jgi:hypothetical protein
MRMSSDRRGAIRNRFAAVNDRELAARYWAARNELQSLRVPRWSAERDVPWEVLAGAFQRIRELDALCAQLWEESQRRASSGSIEAIA